MAIVARRNLGLLTLAVWLILTGVSALVAVPLPGMLLGLLAIIAGVLLLVGR